MVNDFNNDFLKHHSVWDFSGAFGEELGPFVTSPVLYANFVAQGDRGNALFNHTDRDNCNYPYWLLREKFKVKGIHLNTADVNRNEKIAFELHIDVQSRKSSAPIYLLLMEPMAINRNNASEALRSLYRRILTWDDQLVDGCRYVNLRLPGNVENKITSFKLGWIGRDRLCCVIAGNKTVHNNVKNNNSDELYSKRVETIRWFESHAPHAFDLYGTGWDSPPARYSLFGRVWNKASRYWYKVIKKNPFLSYRGAVKNKHDTLKLYRFSICYENISGINGYLSEKIFDCFYAGCVPVYWGAPDILNYVPRECFVDRRQFADHESLYEFLTSMSEEEYINYQQAMQTFLTSQTAGLFSSEAFASKIVNTILADLGDVG